jgi:ABC-type multidrug transport system fused ATPase/permease subunit
MAAAPASSIFFTLSISLTKLLAPTMMGFLRFYPMYLVVRSAMVSLFLFLFLFTNILILFFKGRRTAKGEQRTAKSYFVKTISESRL